MRVTAHAPPRHAKTDTVLAFIADTLKQLPHKTLAYVTYEDRTAKSKSRKAQQWALQAGVELVTTSLNEWRTRQGGGLLATGIGGPLTSQGVDILLVDDPYKNRLQAESASYRAMVSDWQDDVAETRLEPGGSAFIFHTRWVNDDLIGHVLGGEAGHLWKNIKMPALSDAGEVLWPQRWTAKLLEQKKLSVGPYTWASLYQGDPRPRGSAVFNGVHLYDVAPTEGYRVAIGVDLAYSAKTSADYSIAVVLAAKYDATLKRDRFYVLEVLREQVDAPAFKAKLRALHQKYPSATWRTYYAGPEKGVVDLMRTGDGAVPLMGIQASADKFIRAQPAAAAWNRGDILMPSQKKGDVLVPMPVPWANPFVTVIHNFTGVKDKHDDDVDALAAAHDQAAMLSGQMFTGVEMPRRTF